MRRLAVEAALERFLVAAGEDPLVRILLSDDGTGGLLPLVTTQSMPVVAWASARLAAVMRDGWPSVSERDAELLAETLVRLAISYVTVPKDSSARHRCRRSRAARSVHRARTRRRSSLTGDGVQAGRRAADLDVELRRGRSGRGS